MDAAYEAAFAQFDAYKVLVESEGACALPGVNIRYDSFMHCLWGAQRAGYVSRWVADFVADGLRNGFTLGVDLAGLPGQQIFRNYPSAVQARRAVSRATRARVAGGKTLCIGVWCAALCAYVKRRFRRFRIFPMGAVAKPLEPDEMRPTSDHTRSGLNRATDLEFFRHALTAYKDVAAWLRRGCFMSVTDVEAAFPMLPLHPALWPYFMFLFFADDSCDALSLFVHVTGDFGAAGLPGTFKIFFVDAVVPMARFAGALRLQMAVYVDDVALIGPTAAETDAQMRAFQEWAARVCGIVFKTLKDRRAATRQLFLGLWWDSLTFARTLEEKKLVSYIGLLDEFAHARALTLHERRSVAGKMQRAVLTLPPGAACLLANVFALMAGLTLPWQRRRTTQAERDDYALMRDLLRMNMGRGVYRLDDFRSGCAEVWTDASKEASYTGGGYVFRGSRGRGFDFWRYGPRAARHDIMVLEGHTTLVCAQDAGYLWRGLRVLFHIDNMSFKGAAAKGWTRSWHSNIICKRWFVVQLRHGFLAEWAWISTHENVLADALSRNRESEFAREAAKMGMWAAGTDLSAYRHPRAGRVLRLDDLADPVSPVASDVRSALSADCHSGPFGSVPTGPDFPLPVLPDDDTNMSTTRGGSHGGGCPQGLRAPVPGELVTACEVENVAQCDADALGEYCSPPIGGVLSEKYAALGPACDALNPLAASHSACEPGTVASMPLHPSTRHDSKHGSEGATTRGTRTLGRWPIVVLLFLGLCCPVSSVAAPAAAAAQGLSVPYTRSLLFDGLPPDLVTRLQELLDVRLAPSSMRTVTSAMRVWRSVATSYGWPVIMESDDPLRGSKLATLVLTMVEDTSLVYTSISGYIWGVRQWMILQGQLDPILGVANWANFMQAVQVLTHVPSEPRREVPLALVAAILESIDEASFEGVQFAFFLVVLYFCYSRSECPCPKSFSGFDPGQHWQVRDIRWMPVGDGGYALAIRFKAIKQDPRLVRPESRGDGDWAYVGDAPGTIFSVLKWLKALVAFWPEGRRPDAPFFMASDRVRPYTYTCAMSDFRGHIRRVGWDPALYALHGLRVGGYNASLHVNGEELTVLHGGWSSAATASRYRRWSVTRDVVPMASRVVDAYVESQAPPDPAPPPPPPVVVEREVRRPAQARAAEQVAGRRRTRRVASPAACPSPPAPAGRAPAASSSSASSPPASTASSAAARGISSVSSSSASSSSAAACPTGRASLPPGHVRVFRTHEWLNRPYSVVVSPGGVAHSSAAAAWRAWQGSSARAGLPRTRSDPALARAPPEPAAPPVERRRAPPPAPPGPRQSPRFAELRREL